MWLKTTALQKAGVTEKIFKKGVMIVLRKKSVDACYNNHSEITLPLTFLLTMFLSDALMVSNGADFCMAEKPDNALSGWSCFSAVSQCVHPHGTADSLGSDQLLLSVLCEPQFIYLLALI